MKDRPLVVLQCMPALSVLSHTPLFPSPSSGTGPAYCCLSFAQ